MKIQIKPKSMCMYKHILKYIITIKHHWHMCEHWIIKTGYEKIRKPKACQDNQSLFLSTDVSICMYQKVAQELTLSDDADTGHSNHMFYLGMLLAEFFMVLGLNS